MLSKELAIGEDTLYSNLFAKGYIVPLRTKVSVKVCLGEHDSTAFPGCPMPEHASKESIPLGLPWGALLTELEQPLGRRLLVMRCLFKKVSNVTSLSSDHL